MGRLELVTTTKLEVAPKIKTKLLNKMRELQALQLARKALEADEAAVKTEIEGIANDAGLHDALDAGLEIEGFKTKLVYPTRTELDKLKLVAQGVTMEQIDRATVSSTGKPYLRVSPPGAKSGPPRTET